MTKKFDKKALEIFMRNTDKQIQEIKDDVNITRVMKELAKF